MKKSELLILSISIGLTASISVIFGFAGSSLTGPFWAWFWISFIIQLILFVGINSLLLQRDRVATEQFNIQALEELSKFSIKLSCSYCQQPNILPIQLNQKNTFKCESCNQVNGVSMQFTAIPLTTPIESIKKSIESVEITTTSV